VSNHVSIELVDAGEARAAALEDPLSMSRGALLRRALLAGGAMAAGGILIKGLPALPGGLPAVSGLAGPEAARAADLTTDILNYARTLEYLEAEFYTRAEGSGVLRGEARTFARVVGGHERAHVADRKKALGSAAVSKPTFDFKGTTDDQDLFLATAVVLEDTGVAAYNGQAANLIGNKAVLAAAASVVSVEARHAGWVRDIVGKTPAPIWLDTPRSMEQVLGAVGRTGFIVGAGA
jgi:hypothetical protein